MNSAFKLLLLISCIFIASCEDTATNRTVKNPDAKKTSETYKPSLQTSLGILLPTTTANTGDEICLDVTVKDFNTIVSIQHSVNWNVEVLKFKKVQNFNLSGMSAASFGATRTEEGYFAVSWYDPAVQGFTLVDGTKIYEACFEVIGASGASSPIRVTGTPVPVEVSTKNQRLLGIPTGKGKVVVK